MRRLPIPFFLALAAIGACPAADTPATTRHTFLENTRVKIGVDLSSGGAIFWFSSPPAGPNLLNHFDRGRFIQQSYYGKPDGSRWADKPWRWNPVQGGDYKGKPARVLETQRAKDSLFIKSVPVNWAGGQDLDDCRMEQTIRIDDNVARVRFKFAYQGKDKHPPAHQELPAVFVDHSLADLIYYKGSSPWTGAPLAKDRPGWPNERRRCDEEWAAYLGPDGRGLGVYFPGSTEITCYRFAGPPGPKGSGCSYFAPIRTIAINPGFRFEYSITLTAGTAAEIRARFAKEHQSSQSKPPATR